MTEIEITIKPTETVDLCGFDGVAQDDQTTPTSQKLIPFTVTAEQAQATCRAWMGSEFTHPRDLSALAKIAAPTGVYLPAWLWSGRATSTWTAMAVYIEKKEQHKNKKEEAAGTAPSSAPAEVKVIRHPPVPVSGDHEGSYPDMVVLAYSSPTWLSSTWPTEKSYNLDQLIPYDPELARQYRFEPPTSSRDASRSRVCAQIKKAEEEACKASMPGDEVKDPAVKTRVVSLTDTLINLPVWRLSYDYGGKTYRCQVHGQSGASVCEGPVDASRNLLKYAIIALVILAVIVVFFVFTNR